MKGTRSSMNDEKSGQTRSSASLRRRGTSLTPTTGSRMLKLSPRKSTPRSSAFATSRRLSSGKSKAGPAVTPKQNVTKSNVSSVSEPQSTSPQEVQGSPGSQSAPKIRTRLSTGSIHMNGTTTISTAKEKAEMDQIMKEIAKNDGKTGGAKKRSSAAPGAPQEALLGHPLPKRRKIGRNDGTGEDNRNDYFCWMCHKEGSLVCCELCPRVYHTKCLGINDILPNDWVCPECEKIMRAECIDTRSKAMGMLTIDQLCTLLKYALDRMKHSGSEPFQNPVDMKTVPSYSDYVYHSMDLSVLEKNIKKKMYGCTEALLADTKWILHNCIIYNGAHHSLSTNAKMIVKICKHEMNEIELCPDCYLNSCDRKNDYWFSEICRVPHTLVWAKLKGYPFWPSKALRESDGQVDVRFFGAHDRSWVPVSQCFLLSKNIPTSLQKGKKNNGLDMAIKELNIHVKKIRELYGNYDYAPFRTPYDRSDSYKPFNSNVPEPRSPIKPMKIKLSASCGKIVATTHNRPGILRQSTAARTASAVRSKYNAMVSLKRIDNVGGDKAEMHDDKIGDGESAEAELFEKQDGSVCSDSDPVANHSGNTPMKATETSVDTTESKSPEKVVVKKSYVSSSLIERLENKLKALDGDDDDNVQNSDKCSGSDKDADLKETKCIVMKQDADKSEPVTKVISSSNKPLVDVGSTAEQNNDKAEVTGTNESTGSVTNDKTCEDVVVGDKKQTEGEVSDTTQGSKIFVNDLVEGLSSEKPDPDNSKSDLKNDGPSLDVYRTKLETTIKSCKEKLGIDNQIVETDSDDDDSDSNDDDENSSADSEDSDDDSRLVIDSDTGKESEAVENEELDNAKKHLKSVSGNVIKESSFPSDKEENDTVLEETSKSEQTQSSSEKEKVCLGTDKDTSTEVDSNLMEATCKHSEREGYPVTPSSTVEENVTVKPSSQMDSNSCNYSEEPMECELRYSDDESTSEMVVEEGQGSSDAKVEAYDGVQTINDSEKLRNNDVQMIQTTSGDSKEKNIDTSQKLNETVATEQSKNGDIISKHVEACPGKDDICMQDSDRDKVAKHAVESLTVASQTPHNDTDDCVNSKSADSSISALPTSSDKTETKSTEKKRSLDPNTGEMCDENDDDSDNEDLVDAINPSLLLGDIGCPDESGEDVGSCLPDKTFVAASCSQSVDSVVQSTNLEGPKPTSTTSMLTEKFSKKMLEKIQNVMDEMYAAAINKHDETENVETLKNQLAQAKWLYDTELNELKHNFQLTLHELKLAWETEKEQMKRTMTVKHNTKLERAIKETKKKQWCAQCGKEAIFYCCWNTSYCDYPCQQSHWPLHMLTCLQTNKDKSGSNTPVPQGQNIMGQGQNVMGQGQNIMGQGQNILSQGQNILGQGQITNQPAVSMVVSTVPIMASRPSATVVAPANEPNHLQILQDITGVHRKDDKRPDTRPGVSPKSNTSLPSSMFQNIRQPNPNQANMMFRMQSPAVLQQFHRGRFMNPQQNVVQTLYPIQVAQQQQQQQQLQQQQQHQQQQQQRMGGTILFQNTPQNIMSYGMPPRPFGH